MKSLAVVLSLAVLFLTTLPCCVHSPTPDFSGEELVRFSPFPLRWKADFYAIAENYVVNYWDCDDMTQVWADYLFAEGMDWQDMQVVAAFALIRLPDGKTVLNPILGAHCWLEVRYGGSWYVFDPAKRKFGWKFREGARPPNWAQYTIFEPKEAGRAYWDGSGYLDIGDRFDHEKLVWVSRTGEEFSVEQRTGEAHRGGVKTDLEVLRKKRGSSTTK